MYIKSTVAGAAIALIAVFVSPAVADGKPGSGPAQYFAALSGVSAEQLSHQDMGVIRGADHGELFFLIQLKVSGELVTSFRLTLPGEPAFALCGSTVCAFTLPNAGGGSGSPFVAD